MAFNAAAASRKLNAILAKDLPTIHANGVRIPFLSQGYTLAQLQAWIAKRSDMLANVVANPPTDNQINNAKTQIYNGLSAADRAIADAILAGQEFDLGAASSAAAYDDLVLIVLYVFITTPGD